MEQHQVLSLKCPDVRSDVRHLRTLLENETSAELCRKLFNWTISPFGDGYWLKNIAESFKSAGPDGYVALEAALMCGGALGAAARGVIARLDPDERLQLLVRTHIGGSALYAGTFGPFTLAHENLVARAARMFDRVVVGVGVNSTKQGLFTPEETVNMIIEEVSKLKGNIEVVAYTGLTATFARSVECGVLIRGVRAITDFDQEIQLRANNAQLEEGLDTIFLPSEERFANVSSTAAREILRAEPNRSIPWLLSPRVEGLLRAKLRSGSSTPTMVP